MNHCVCVHITLLPFRGCAFAFVTGNVSWENLAARRFSASFLTAQMSWPIQKCCQLPSGLYWPIYLLTKTDVDIIIGKYIQNSHLVHFWLFSQFSDIHTANCVDNVIHQAFYAEIGSGCSYWKIYIITAIWAQSIVITSAIISNCISFLITGSWKSEDAGKTESVSSTLNLFR